MPARDIPNFSWVSATLAPATRAPLESCTVTRREPVGFWACSAGGRSARTTAPKDETARAMCFRATLRMDPDLASLDLGALQGSQRTSGCLSKGSKPFGNRVRIAAGLVNSVAQKYGGQADGGAGDRVTPRRGLATSINKPTHALAHETCRTTAAFQGGTGHSRLAIAVPHTPAPHTKKASRSSPFSNGWPKSGLQVFAVQMDLIRPASNAGGTCWKHA